MKLQTEVEAGRAGALRGRVGVAVMVLGAAAFGVHAADVPSPREPALKAYADVRYRLETVDQDGIARSAIASTLRARLGVRTREWHGLSALLEGEAIGPVGGERYNDTVNGRTQYPIVADPGDDSINQAWLRWRWGQRFELNAGRQAVNLDNQRWIGSVGWRQNDQTLDGAGVSVKPRAGMSLSYSHVWRVNRVFGRDSAQGVYGHNRIHLIRLAQDIKGAGTLVAYNYLLDLPDAPAASARTLGARFAGSHALGISTLKLLYAAEYARQSDYGRNPRDFGLDYWLVEPGIASGPWSLKLGYERLDGNGIVALQTPLATLHAFNGWADKFLTTPPNGLRDMYGDATWKMAGSGLLRDTSLRLAYHDYHSVSASQRYGTEWNFLVSHPVGRHFVAMAKYASYDADRLASDTRKLWLQMEAKF
ncbi:MAG: hypothetical protein IT480_13095 [Gammaproteobacteria bacterium]|nr:hypothetical protein [Gammaproteobacteria bacterium]